MRSGPYPPLQPRSLHGATGRRGRDCAPAGASGRKKMLQRMAEGQGATLGARVGGEDTYPSWGCSGQQSGRGPLFVFAGLRVCPRLQPSRGRLLKPGAGPSGKRRGRSHVVSGPAATDGGGKDPAPRGCSSSREGRQRSLSSRKTQGSGPGGAPGPPCGCGRVGYEGHRLPRAELPLGPRT